MNQARLVQILCAASAVVCIGMASLRAWQVMEPAVRWTRAEAKVEGVRVSYRHDGDARLLFFVEAKVRFPANGAEVLTVAKSGLYTHAYAESRAEVRKVLNVRNTKVYYDPANPSLARFNLDYSRLYDLQMGLLLGGALALSWFGAWFARYWAGRTTCARCKMPNRPRFTYCPHCRTLLKPASA
jgi:hypothetical protein